MALNIISNKSIFEFVASAPENDDKKFVDSNGKRIMPGDMLAFDRGTFYHYALYVKNGMLLHVTKVETDDKASVILQDLEGVRNGCKFFVRNHDEEAWDKYKAKPRSLDEIWKAAAESVGKQLDYNLLQNNCEHNCDAWRYGVSFSSQVNTAIEVLKVSFVGSIAASAAIAYGRESKPTNKPKEVV